MSRDHTSQNPFLDSTSDHGYPVQFPLQGNVRPFWQTGHATKRNNYGAVSQFLGSAIERSAATFETESSSQSDEKMVRKQAKPSALMLTLWCLLRNGRKRWKKWKVVEVWRPGRRLFKPSTRQALLKQWSNVKTNYKTWSRLTKMRRPTIRPTRPTSAIAVLSIKIIERILWGHYFDVSPINCSNCLGNYTFILKQCNGSCCVMVVDWQFDKTPWKSVQRTAKSFGDCDTWWLSHIKVCRNFAKASTSSQPPQSNCHSLSWRNGFS